MLVPCPKIRSDCAFGRGVQQVLLEVFWVPEGLLVGVWEEWRCMDIESAKCEMWLNGST